MDRDDFMRYERFKSINKAISELETAMMTFYNGEYYQNELKEILEQLKEYKKDYL